MQYKVIGGTDLKVSSICMGSTHLSRENDAININALLDRYTELDGNFIDTANVYGKWLRSGKSISEINIGQWMKDRKNRNNLVIATKGGHPEFRAMHISRLSKKDVAADLDESLGSLQTDRIDLYWLHRDDANMPVGEIIEYLNGFVQDGKIRYFGCSNWKPARIAEAIDYARQKKLMGFVGNQMLWNLAKLNDDPFDDKTMVIMDAETYGLHRSTGLAAIPYTSQANGFFDKLDRLSLSPLNDTIKRAYLNEENIRRLHRIKTLGADLSATITEIVLSYLLSQPFTTIPIVGCSNPDQLAASMKAADRTISRDALAYLDGGQYEQK
jgi:aryl-alcohol dehydrogenase-like predicted oxidoreductase